MRTLDGNVFICFLVSSIDYVCTHSVVTHLPCCDDSVVVMVMFRCFVMSSGGADIIARQNSSLGADIIARQNSSF